LIDVTGNCGIVLRMTWKVLGLSQKDAQFMNKWRRIEWLRERTEHVSQLWNWV